MKKVSLLIIVTCFLGSACAFAAQNPASDPDEQLIGLSSPAARISEIERRMSDLERELRYQKDYTRNLEREITNLKRRA